MLVRRLAVVAAFALAVSGSASATSSWKRVTIVRHEGATQLTVSFEQRTDGVGVGGLRGVRLLLRRGGRTVIDDRWPAAYSEGGISSVTLRNVWGSSDLEALVEIWTGGNACCQVLRVGLVGADGTGRVLARDFGMGWRGGQSRGAFAFVSADSRFYCAFSDCASSSQPIQIVAIDKAGRRFVDVTRSRRDLIAADAAEQWKGYTRELGKHNQYERLGVLGPWCADEYLLGLRDRCTQILEHALARGYLNAPQGGRTGVDLLLRKLAAWGYDRR